ncbi:hypothetical protein P168DRAFT_297569 [Aspergillus campestris IBT 28561]|uniref:Uncharacterized protein n=1 Tax=Aspergillus campestris (strain IBT 28561) TaxID=1392248 RepID=A0A2I1D1C3_ASPC2|nr:uncharacterized protein P168DRAFT_297569 [Aspergillus campestris IBT 28561]PKY03672.1 hypothetical protein P168DRAFT_297569 [Aspergillus campestris IBT 28561]
MAIWPFGRKNKRHTIQVDAPAAGESAAPQEPRLSLDGRKPSRKNSKRQKNRHFQPVEDCPTPLHDALPPPRSVTSPPLTSNSEQLHRKEPYGKPTSHIGHISDGYTSRSTVNHDPSLETRNSSVRRSKRSDGSPAVLKKRLSKRKAYEIAREREIRLMASTPIDIPRRSTLPGEDFSMETPRGRLYNRRSDRELSETNLSIRDSTASSLSEFSESYKFKVNGFSAWTPRPVIRYVEAPRIQTAKSQKTIDSGRKEKMPVVSASEENLYTKKRINRLADGLDAGALRELLERDRRRTERQKVEDQDKLHRKLQRAADRQRAEAELNGVQTISEVPRGQVHIQSLDDVDETGQDASKESKNQATGPRGPSESWLHDSKDHPRSRYESMESVHVIGNIDDSSIREPKLGLRRSFAPSQDMGMSRSTLSPSHSPSRRGFHSPTPSQVYGIGRESTSDVSRTVDSERRLSDNGSGRINTISSIFRRGSSRLKRRYRERFQDRSPEPSNASHESFFKPIPAKPYMRTGTIKRSQSKFTEHLGDEPLSPPDSRIQSPDIPEEPADVSEPGNGRFDFAARSQYPILGSESDLQDASKDRHRSWAGEILEDDMENDNVPLSQSLASIDSEGSWMSGQFLRRISHRKSNQARASVNSSRNVLVEGMPTGDAVSGKENIDRSDSRQEVSNAPTNATGAQEPDFEMIHPAEAEEAEETWHDHIAKRPILVNPMDVQSLSPITTNEEFSPIEEHSAEIFEATPEGNEPGLAR